MAVKKRKKTSASTWRDLKASSAKKSKKPVHWRARARKIFSALKIFLPLALALGGAGFAFYLYMEKPEVFEISEGRVEKIEFRTDGSLTKEWLGGFLNLKPSSKLSEVNIFKIKDDLESMGQIHSANVERVFPSTLRIGISERLPFARVSGFAPASDGRIYAMSRDGKIFLCKNFEGMENLVEIIGAKTKAHFSFEKMDYAHAEELFAFWALVKKRFPDFSKTLKVLDVSQMDSLTLPGIKAYSSLGIEIFFIKGDYEKQLDRLEYILAYAAEKNISKIKKIDLSLKDRAIVETPD